MLYRLLYDLLRLLIEVLIVRGRSDAQLRAEVLGLGPTAASSFGPRPAIPRWAIVTVK